MKYRDAAEEYRYKQLAEMPFGGFIVIFCGDFYQLPCVMSTPIYKSILRIPTERKKTLHGHDIWLTVNVFIELKRNFRFKDDADGLLPLFLEGARIGEPDDKLLDAINGQCLVTSSTLAKKKSYEGSIWIAPTNALVNDHNITALDHLRLQGISSILPRIIALTYVYCRCPFISCNCYSYADYSNWSRR